MSYVQTYAQNADIQAHLPFTLSDTSRPKKEDVESWRLEVYGMINERIGGSVTDKGGLKRLEVKKVLQLLDNYYARGRGERTVPVEITEADIDSLRLNQSTSGFGYGGAHFSTDIPR